MRNCNVVTMRQMLERCHFGHQTRFWNPKLCAVSSSPPHKIHHRHLERTLENFQAASKFVRQ